MGIKSFLLKLETLSSPFTSSSYKLCFLFIETNCQSRFEISMTNYSMPNVFIYRNHILSDTKNPKLYIFLLKLKSYHKKNSMNEVVSDKQKNNNLQQNKWWAIAIVAHLECWCDARSAAATENIKTLNKDIQVHLECYNILLNVILLKEFEMKDKKTVSKSLPGSLFQEKQKQN